MSLPYLELYCHRMWTADKHKVGPMLSAYGRYPNKFILREFVSYLGERRVMCVGNGWHFCTPVLMNMCNITLKVPRLSTFVFKKSSEKIYLRLYSRLRAWRVLVGIMLTQRRTVVQHYFTNGPMYRVIRVVAFQVITRHPYGSQSKHGTIT